MDIRAYQRWVQEYDQARGWDLCPGTDTLAHLVEELGEVTRCVLGLHGYRNIPPQDMEAVKEDLGEELADLVTFAVKLAYTYDLDLAKYLVQNQAKCAARFGEGTGSYETEAYLEGLARAGTNLLAQYRQRFREKE